MTKHSAFNWADALSLASDLTEEERFVQKTAADFADKRLLPGIVEANRSGHFDREIMREMGALGLLGPTLPEEYGGAAVSHAPALTEPRHGPSRKRGHGITQPGASLF